MLQVTIAQPELLRLRMPSVHMRWRIHGTSVYSDAFRTWRPPVRCDFREIPSIIYKSTGLPPILHSAVHARKSYVKGMRALCTLTTTIASKPGVRHGHRHVWATRSAHLSCVCTCANLSARGPVAPNKRETPSVDIWLLRVCACNRSAKRAGFRDGRRWVGCTV